MTQNNRWVALSTAALTAALTVTFGATSATQARPAYAGPPSPHHLCTTTTSSS